MTLTNIHEPYDPVATAHLHLRWCETFWRCLLKKGNTVRAYFERYGPLRVVQLRVIYKGKHRITNCLPNKLCRKEEFKNPSSIHQKEIDLQRTQKNIQELIKCLFLPTLVLWNNSLNSQNDLQLRLRRRSQPTPFRAGRGPA